MGLLVYPPLEHETDSPSIFFIGSAQNYCSINSQLIDLVYAGNFCPVLPLELGENIFDIDIDGEIFNCKIFRTISSPENPPDARLTSPSHQSLLNVNEDGEDEYNDADWDFRRICIDPGHGGMARGTCSPKGVKEKDLNLSLAKLLKDKLSSNGFEVLLTREFDVDLSLADRVAMSKNFAADLFISIHHNAIPDHQNPLEHRGISAHYYYEHSKSLALDLLDKISKSVQLSDAGIVRQNLYVLRENPHIPSVLLEMGYLIHPLESEIIVGTEFQEKAVQGILDFFQNGTGD